MTAHHFTVDVEEYFQVSAFEDHVKRSDWPRFPSRLASTVHRMLELLSAQAARGTFFVLGWVAKKHPQVVRAIANAGHEIGSHGWDHKRVTEQSPDEFRESVRRTRLELQDLVGQPVLGFRAPSFSIVPGLEWALDVLLEEGYGYDSSLFPVRRRGYGYPIGPADPYVLERPAGRLLEFPPATITIGGVRVPAGGGAYFRLFPYHLVAAALRRSEQRGMPATFYIHPWELDPAQPRVAVGWPQRLRHYGGLQHTESRLSRLLRQFRFTAIADAIHRPWETPALAPSA